MTYSLSDFGYIRVAAASPKLKVADVSYNTTQIIDLITQAAQNNCHLIVFPELSVTGYTCADLFFQHSLLQASEEALLSIADSTKQNNSTVIVGFPAASGGKLFNAGVVISCGKLKAVVPKTYLPNTNEYYEQRWFASEFNRNSDQIKVCGQSVPFGADILFKIDYGVSGLKPATGCIFGLEICEDLWAVIPPSMEMSLNGANLIFNLSASNESLGKSSYRKELVKTQSARCLAAYCYSSSGIDESSTDLVFSGHSIIAENGIILAENNRFSLENQINYSDIDVEYLNSERRRNSSYRVSTVQEQYKIIDIMIPELKTDNFYRKVTKTPFVPDDLLLRSDSCKEIFSIQTSALAKRLLHIGKPSIVIGVSGGLDSTLALLAAVKTFEKLGYDLKNIHAISMPGFGTSKRTRFNSEKLIKKLGVSFRSIPIKKAIERHFKDIGQPPDLYNIVYENAQARERTQILMDIANQVEGIVLGTGDLSEIALGWSTYNGDHISMYGINSGIPKTLVKYIIEWCAEFEFSGELTRILLDICNTPISPELLPTNINGEIGQHTEKSIGPFILHDFFLFYCVRCNFSPKKIIFLADKAFLGIYDLDFIKKYLKLFYERFFRNQFKRSCMPDGPKVGSVALSPRGDWRMPSDASPSDWIKRIEDI